MTEGKLCPFAREECVYERCGLWDAAEQCCGILSIVKLIREAQEA